MSVIYLLIAKDTDVVLCEFTEHEGNFNKLAENLLPKVKQESRSTFGYDNT